MNTSITSFTPHTIKGFGAEVSDIDNSILIDVVMEEAGFTYNPTPRYSAANYSGVWVRGNTRIESYVYDETFKVPMVWFRLKINGITIEAHHPRSYNDMEEWVNSIWF